MNLVKSIAILAAAGSLSACVGAEGFEGGGLTAHGTVPADKSIDRGINAHDLSTLIAGIWVDPNGCDHWIIDDGVEGYLSERLTPDGLPVCSGVAPPETATGPFKDGTPIPDFL
ncbi:hypothetical protein EU803_11455 [Loktanella sp. IMCC34160]|uniref:hypothetical protein n=1 Tax=Loktanella sp. IMCC34160 TaxID=2510646 RepID=UPI00101C6798|nr:hypothetical protein [Loktanella sp. IMCC34160]RYG90613.1 hypothetical protein EU803_11455 [Loktanella sp. IMCC34160]